MSYYLPFDPIIRLGQQFGWNPGLGPNPAGGHNGDDWLTPVGTPVRAAGDGVVVFAGQFDSTYEDNWGWNLHYGGLMVVLNMDGPTAPYFEYGHNSRVLVKAGDRVVAGQVIAITGNTDGNTGISTGPHCHVGCLPWNYNLGSNTYGRVNPRTYMTKHWDGGNISLASTSVALTPQSTITPLTPTKEGFLMDLSYEDQVEVRDNLRKLVKAADEEKLFDAGVNEKVDELVGNARKTFWNTQEAKLLLANTPAPQLAAQIDAAGLAAAVRDELIELLKGK